MVENCCVIQFHLVDPLQSTCTWRLMLMAVMLMLLLKDRHFNFYTFFFFILNFYLFPCAYFHLHKHTHFNTKTYLDFTWTEFNHRLCICTTLDQRHQLFWRNHGRINFDFIKIHNCNCIFNVHTQETINTIPTSNHICINKKKPFHSLTQNPKHYYQLSYKMMRKYQNST